MRNATYLSSIKTSAPSLDGVIERPRLLGTLVQLPSASRWLQSPSGTGKSTLASVYARKSGKAFAWYRLDERDNDPAFFYAEFAAAVDEQLRLTGSLPHFSADDRDRQTEFARRYFGTLATHIIEPVLIVFDDVQRLTADSMTSSLAQLIQLAPQHVELLFVSETVAPTALFDAIAQRRLSLLNDIDLRFNPEECEAITAPLRIDRAQCEQIAKLTGGHAGAMVLACELLRGVDTGSALGVETVERIHSHLLSKLIDRMPPTQRELLLRTAFLVQVTRPLAEALAGVEAALELDALVAAGLLRRAGDGPEQVYEAHGLVRAGMQALVRGTLGAAAARILAERTAAVLIDDDQLEAALALLLDMKFTARAITVLERLAEHYSQRGHTDLLMSVVARLPEAAVHGNAWVCFWTGQALLRINEQRARIWLGRAYAAFEAAGDMTGMRLAAASVVTAFGLEFGDLREADSWMVRHSLVGGDTPVAAGDRFETCLIMGVMCAAFFRGRYTPPLEADALIERMRLLLDSPHGWLSGDQRVQAARILIETGAVFQKDALVQTVILATRPLIDNQIGGTLHRGRWLISAAKTHFNRGETERSVDCLSQARLLTQRSHSAQLTFELGLAFAGHWMKTQDLPRAAEELSSLEAGIGHVAPAERAEFTRMTARLLLLQQRLPEGLRWAEEARRMALPAGFTGANLRAFEVELVYALAANDRLAEALELVTSLVFDPPEIRTALQCCLRFLAEDKGDLQTLRQGLKNASQIGFFNLFDRARGLLARLCDAALAYDIETEFVLQIVSMKKLAPPPLAGPSWPWAVRVWTCGGFRLDIEGHRYKPPRKTQDKPLDLLKLLATSEALGRDSADKAWVIERLWPDAEPINARKSLDMTIGRLRRLLRCDDSVLMSEGRLQLSPNLVWTDIRSLRNAFSVIRGKRDEHVAGRRQATSEVTTAIATVLRHYVGPYLADEEDEPWLLAGREATASAVRQALAAADVLLEGAGDAVLIPALETVLAADPTSEELGRALMRAHLRQGQNGEALRVYRRLREMLSLVLGIAPSAELEDIRERAYANERAKC